MTSKKKTPRPSIKGSIREVVFMITLSGSTVHILYFESLDHYTEDSYEATFRTVD